MGNITAPIAWEEQLPDRVDGDEGTPPEEWKTTSHPQHPRTEIKRWVRGNRYVRICQVQTAEMTVPRYYLHYGWRGQPGTDSWHNSREELAAVLQEARTLMRIGGRP